MCKNEIFLFVLNEVSKETEISEEQILSSSKDMETVDARSIVVKLLSEMDMYPKRIATYMGKTPASIRYLITHHEARKKANKMIGKYMSNIRKRIENN